MATEISAIREEQGIDERFEQDLESAPLIPSQEALGILLYCPPSYRYRQMDCTSVVAFNCVLPRPQAERIERGKVAIFTKQGLFPVEDNPVTLQEKQNPEMETRAAEEEGIYVPEVLLPPRRVWIALEHRLVREGARNWFGEDGQLKGLIGNFRTSSKKG